MKVIYTDEAEADLVEIGIWIAHDSPRRAHTFVDELREACEALAEFPKMYRLIPRHERFGIRRRPYGNYLIFYRLSGNTVQILHVLHGARDYEVLLFPEE